MKYGSTIIILFALVSIGSLTLWAVHDLWVVLLVLFAIAGAHKLLTSKS